MVNGAAKRQRNFHADFRDFKPQETNLAVQ